MTEEARKRIRAELDKISPKGGETKLFENPDAVLYYGLPSTLGVVDSTDVLVLVPSGYPGAMIDGAYLPLDSKLFEVVKGQPQNQFVELDGRKWKLVSYHPHNGGGAPPWDPTVHGFHTYIDELLSWLSKKR